MDDFDELKFHTIAAWLRHVVAGCGQKPFKRLIWELTPRPRGHGSGAINTKIRYAKELTHVVHKTGVRLVRHTRLSKEVLRLRYFDLSGPFATDCPFSSNTYYIAVLLDALNLARAAYDMEWTEETLNHRFELFADNCNLALCPVVWSAEPYREELSTN